MRSFRFVVVLLFAFVTTSIAWPDVLPTLEARKHRNNGTDKENRNPDHKACRQMAKLTRLTSLAANQTKLDRLVAKGKLNTTQVDNIKAKAQEATTTLQTMQSNTTLVGVCEVFEARREVVKSCERMSRLRRLAKLANDTAAKDALVKKKQFNATQVAKLDQRIANATMKLQNMMSNTTLTGLCAQLKAERTGNKSSTNTSSAELAASTGGAATLAAQTLPFVIGVGAVFAMLL